LRARLTEAGIEAVDVDGELRVAATPERVGELAAAAGIVLHELRRETASLEEVFLELTGGEAQ
jgi:ABC-2 type transport system ATP-binding protein